MNLKIILIILKKFKKKYIILIITFKIVIKYKKLIKSLFNTFNIKINLLNKNSLNKKTKHLKKN